MVRTGIAEITLEEERQEALDSIFAGLAEKPQDRITKLACAYLLRHLRPDAEIKPRPVWQDAEMKPRLVQQDAELLRLPSAA